MGSDVCEWLIVDGYNIINAWFERKTLAKGGLEAARIALCSRLASFCAFAGWRLLVVFDAHLSEGPESVETHEHMSVVYTRRGETADGYIERYVRCNEGRFRVATNDALEQTMVLGAGAARMSARELLHEVQRAEKQYESYAPRSYAPLETRMDERLRGVLEDWRRS